MNSGVYPSNSSLPKADSSNIVPKSWLAALYVVPKDIAASDASPHTLKLGLSALRYVAMRGDVSRKPSAGSESVEA